MNSRWQANKKTGAPRPQGEKAMYNQQNQNPAQGQKNGSTNTNTPNVPEARAALDNMKFEIASELGINLKQGYNGDLPSRQAGYIGGYMVKRMIEQQERQMSGK